MMLHQDTSKSMALILEDLPKACAAHKFGVLGSIDLRAKLAEKGQTYPHAVLIFDVCNPVHARRALEADPAVSTMLPCRISAYELRDGLVRLACVRPTSMIGGLGVAALDAVAREVEQALDAILHDAAK